MAGGILRRRTNALCATFVALLLVPVLASCGSSTSLLATTITPLTQNDTGPYNPGDTPTFEITVKNKGPAAATGVSIHIDLPGQFKYKATTSISGDGSRTEAVDPHVGDTTPAWGLWSLGPPTVAGDGTVTDSEVDLDFTVVANGQPGNYEIVAHSTGDTSDSDAQAPTLPVQMQAAPNLAMSAAVNPKSVNPTSFNGSNVTYTISVVNTGTGDAANVGILVSLPPDFDLNSTKAQVKVSGNSTRPSEIDPWPDSSAPFFGQFTIPAESSAGEGMLTLSFQVKVNHGTPSGSFPITVEATDDSNDQIVVTNTAIVAVG